LAWIDDTRKPSQGLWLSGLPLHGLLLLLLLLLLLPLLSQPSRGKFW